MAGKRVLVGGIGADLGSRVAVRLEDESWVGDLLGIDSDPPRRRLHRTDVRLADPADRQRIVELITDFDPQVVVYLSVWEPASRAAPLKAKELTDQAAVSMLGAIAECRSLETLVVRSGLEVYGRRRGSPTRPDESAPIDPTSPFGTALATIERRARAIGRDRDIPVALIRLASVLGPHVPSPLGRLLRLPALPFSLLADAPFTVVEDEDSARAFVAAAERRLDGPVNVTAEGAITALQAIRRGGKLPIPLIGPEWMIARRWAELLGAPVPDHVLETLQRGRLADNRSMTDLLGFEASSTTVDVVDRMFNWPSVIHIAARQQVA